MNARPERHGLLDREARIERGVAVLEDHLNFATVGDEIERGRADNFAIEQELARIGWDDLHDEAGERGLAATGLTDDAKRLALGDVEAHIVDGMHRTADAAAAKASPAAEMLDEAAHRQQRLRRPAATAPESGRVQRLHHFTSMADRKPSDRRLNATEVMKIMAPGSAATSGWT